MKPARLSKNKMLIDVKQSEVEYFGTVLGELSTKLRSSIQTKSSHVSYKNINGKSLGVTFALPLYKKAKNPNNGSTIVSDVQQGSLWIFLRLKREKSLKMSVDEYYLWATVKEKCSSLYAIRFYLRGD